MTLSESAPVYGVLCFSSSLWRDVCGVSAVGAQPSVVAALLLLVLPLCPECGGRATAVWRQGIL